MHARLRFLTRSCARPSHSAFQTRRHSSNPALQRWIDYVQSPRAIIHSEEHISLPHVQALVSTIETQGDVPASKWSKGDDLPEGWTLAFFPPALAPTSQLNRADATEVTDHHPPSTAGLDERMWVGGQWQFVGERLKIGQDVQCEARIIDVKQRTGKDGRLGVYVSQQRDIRPVGASSPSLLETRTHLYRTNLNKTEPVSAGDKVAPENAVAAKRADFEWTFHPTPPHLIRFSALTFNAHRIHWDEAYCRNVERRPGLIVHGPLTALLLLNTFRTAAAERRVLSFDYRATAPLVVNTEVTFGGQWRNGSQTLCDLWCVAKDGTVHMTATGTVELASDASPSALLQELFGATTRTTRANAAAALATYVQKNGLHTLALYGITDELVRAATKAKEPSEREGAMAAVEELARKLASHGGADAYLNSLLPVVLDRYQESGKTQTVADAAERAAKQLVRLSPPELAPKVIEELFAVIESPAKWRSKVGALELLATFATSAKDQVAERLGDYVPRLTNPMRDVKSEISNKAEKTGIALCKVLTNPDIQPFVPDLVKCMADPTTVPAAIKRLSSTVWVREVDSPTLAVVAPLLTRALGERGTTVQRQTVVLITNLFKLVRSPDLAAQHAAAVSPGIDRIIEGAAFPEIRAFAEEAKQAVDAACEGAATPAVDHFTEALADEKAIYTELQNSVETATGSKPDEFANVSLAYIAYAVSHLVRKRAFGDKEWKETYVGPYLSTFMDKTVADGIAADLKKRWMDVDKSRQKVDDADFDDEEGEIVVDLPFSLAYGGLLLLNYATLKLRRGHRYGICGANGCGKSTLLKAINRKQIENFPEDLKAAYVEHDIDGDESGITVAQLMIEEPRIKADETEIRATLSELGFDAERQDKAINSLSGGWKMRVALCRAMLMKVDLLLLDEPTNHLDVQSVAWLQDCKLTIISHLNAQSHITCMIISHDSGFLDAVCTNIIHYQKKQLHYYQGNLAKFVEKYPAAKTYYTLSASVVKFTFPAPGSLMGVRSATKTILKMSNCTFTYPGQTKPQLKNVSVAVSLSSRVGIVGPNGAGKSTLIKLLTGETLPDSGKVEKHPNLRIAYVAQHAFHHIEEHLEKTAVQYIMWRYQEGVDKEQAHKATRALTPEEQELLKKPFTGSDGSSRYLERIVGRQKLKKSYTYEIKWQGMLHKFNTFIPRERLLELGFSKLVQEFDDFEASREGAGSREMSGKLVRKHLEDVGLDGDIAEYNEMKGLSGGQKVKVVIAAAMWSKPQMLILDEPTNFLDRDALGGLAVGIKEWTGAFLCISHSQEFIGALCPEIWNVENGELTHKGKAAVADDAFESSNPNSIRGTPAGTPALATPAGVTPAGTPGASTPAVSTPAGSGDEARAAATIAGAEQELQFKAAKGRKKMTRKQMKEREERRRLRTLRFLSSSVPGAVREPDTESDEEVDGKQLRAVKKAAAGATPPKIAGMAKK
ncbi:[NU+] prion formation protein 1 [Microbotryomycetes sp. JL201]|nr:[NU+] prion formation protein 1 [Microbotryomycetes sp. JL201]